MGRKKLTLETVKENCKKIHGNKYDYSTTSYINSTTKLKIKCPKHGYFFQRYYDHLKGSGCPSCGGVERLNSESFIEKAKLVHGDKYNYSNVVYKNTETKVEIICFEHGAFQQTPHSHLYGKGCNDCGRESTISSHKKSNDAFLKKAKEVHADRYEYIDEYIDQYSKIKIKCLEHGIFVQSPKYHLQGSGCQECAKFYKGRIKSLEHFIEEANSVHGDKYDYSNLNFSYITKKGNIICNEHGEFKQLLINHIDGIGCPNCKESKGEKIIRNFLKENKIEFESQKRFVDCKNERALPFDFYLPKFNICIEYDGEQHYKSKEFFGGKDGFKKIRLRDKIKTEYCLEKNIELLRIKFNEDILEFLRKKLDICYYEQ